MTDRVAESSPRLKARIAGVLYLFPGAAFAEFYVRSRLIVRDDAAATATNILAHESLFRLGFAADLVYVACYVGVTAILYVLLKPVSKSLSLLAAFFSLAGCAVMAANLVNQLAAVVVLGDAPYLAVFKTDQLQALALMFLKLHGLGSAIVMVFFGFYCLSIGYLILRSTFLPRILGLLLMIAGLSYLTYSFARFLSPELAAHLFPYILMPGVAELLLALWLLVVGVNAAKWQKQASATGQP